MRAALAGGIKQVVIIAAGGCPDFSVAGFECGGLGPCGQGSEMCGVGRDGMGGKVYSHGLQWGKVYSHGLKSWLTIGKGFSVMVYSHGERFTAMRRSVIWISSPSMPTC